MANRPALWMAAAFAVGIAAAEVLRPHPALALALVLGCVLWLVCARRRTALAELAVVAALGAFDYSYAQTAGRGDLGAWTGRKVAVVGTVTAEPELRGKAIGYALTVEQVEGRPAAGKLYVTQWGDGAPAYGERVEVRGTLKEPAGPRTPGGFDRAAYLARQSIYLTLDTNSAGRMGPGNLDPLHRVAFAARTRLEGVLKAMLPGRDAALMAGLLLGSRSDLPDDITEAFRETGVLHLLAVSGGNVAMVLMPLLWLLGRFWVPKRWASAAGIPLVVFFVLLTGAGPSVMRAGLMAVLVLLGAVLRREKDAVNTLGAAAAILLGVAPGLLFDAGFQLSAAATLGILLFARPIEAWLAPRLQALFGPKIGGWVAAGLSVTFAAQVLVEPVSLHHFGAFSAIAPLANLLVATFVELLVPPALLLTLLGLAALPVAKVLAWPLPWLLAGLVIAIKGMAIVPFAYLEVGHLSTGGMVLWYAAVAVAASPALRGAIARALQPARGRPVLAAVCAALVLTTGLTWRLALAAPPDTLRVTFLDVGQGDAIVIESPDGKVAVVDAGPYVPPDPKSGRPAFDAGAEVVVPYLKDQGARQVDYLILTHPDQDHAGGGVSILEGMSVSAVLKSDENPTEQRYHQALEIIRRKSIPARQPVAGERISLGARVVLEVINPPAQRYHGTRSDDNSNCIALRVHYRQVSLLLACDLEGDIEERLAAAGAPLQADLLKAAHHGSGYSTTDSFLHAVNPRYAVLSVGNGNRYGHPAPSVVERLRQAGVETFRTDRHGTVTVDTDGFALAVRGARGGPADDRYKPLGLLGRRWLRAW